MATQLSPQQETTLRYLVATGQYASQKEALDAALYLLEAENGKREQFLRDIDQGIQSLEQGMGVDGEAAFDEILMKLHLRTRK